MFIFDPLQTPVQAQKAIGKLDTAESTATTPFSEWLGEFQSLIVTEEGLDVEGNTNESESIEWIEGEELAELQQELVAFLTSLMIKHDGQAGFEQLTQGVQQDQNSTTSLTQEQKTVSSFDAKMLSAIDAIHQNGLESISRNVADELRELIRTADTIATHGEAKDESLVQQRDVVKAHSAASQSDGDKQADAVKLEQVVGTLIAKLKNQLVQLPQAENVEQNNEQLRMFAFASPGGIHGLIQDKKVTVHGDVRDTSELTLQENDSNLNLEKAGQQTIEHHLPRSQIDMELANPFQPFLNRLDTQGAKPEITPIHTERFLPEMTELLVSKLQFSTLAEGGEARVSLFPEHLGHVDVKIALQQGQVIAQFIAETNLGKELLETHLAALRSSLQQQGVHVTRIDVQTAAEANLLNQQQQSHERSGAFKQNQNSKQQSSSVLGVNESYQDEVTGVYDRALGSATERAQQSKTKIDLTA